MQTIGRQRMVIIPVVAKQRLTGWDQCVVSVLYLSAMFQYSDSSLKNFEGCLKDSRPATVYLSLH